MRFPLADWIDGHPGCRHDLAQSGMHGELRVPAIGARAVRSASSEELARRLAELLAVDPSRLFLTHGATEANAWVSAFVRRRLRSLSPRCRVRYPEYPPLFEGAAAAGFRLVETDAAAQFAVVSQPNNPTGARWEDDALLGFAQGAQDLLVDETFREFTSAPSVLRLDLPALWTTGSFTKVYGADAVRVGFVVAPERRRDAFARFHGLVTDEVAPYSVALATAILDARPRLLREARGIFSRNAIAWVGARGGPRPVGPTVFDRPDSGGTATARACLAASVLVCPGRFFGDRSGVRVCLTRRTFPADLAAYLAVVARGAG
jgi:aspartate/methionine/tyrosine aminotransferase